MENRILKLVALAAFAGLAATGCASTPVAKTTAAAPITYKIGQGDAQYASLDYSNRSSRPSLPRSYDPAGGQGRDFDPAKVDRNLYSHQKVGKRYTIMGKSYTPKHDPDYNEVGEASWYGPKFHGKPTANGETFNKNAMTAAHKTLPLNSLVRVTNLENGRAITVRLNDRGPFIGKRIIDLSEAAAKDLGYTQNGLATVRVRYLGPANPAAGSQILPRNEPRLAELPRENLQTAPRPYTHTPRPVAPQPTAPRQLAPNSLIPEFTAPEQNRPRLAELPLNDMPSTPAPRYAEPSLPAPIAPSNPRRAPEDDLPSGGDITMTIKGPIHIARSDSEENSPRFISGPAKTK